MKSESQSRDVDKTISQSSYPRGLTAGSNDCDQFVDPAVKPRGYDEPSQLKFIENMLTPYKRYFNDSFFFKGIQGVKNRLKPSFLIIVLLPWLLISIYLVFIKTPEYKSTLSIFFGQKTEASAADFSRLKAIFNRGKQMVTGSEATSVLLTQKYIYSPSMLTLLEDSINIRRYYQSSAIDFFSRLKKDANQQELLNYYLKKVKVISDPTTGELILSAKAFSPEKAQEFLKVIAKNAIHYLNEMTEASLMAQTKLSRSYLQLSRQHFIKTRLALNALIHKNKTSLSEDSESLALKRLDLKFAQTEYEAAQQAYVIWSLATHHNTPVVTSPETLPDYIDAPRLPNDLISAFLILSLGYLLGCMILVIVREHID